MTTRHLHEYKLDQLALAAGVSPRTVRYYVQRGLLAAPVFRAKDTAYDQSHLVRLRAIKKLQEAFLPLDAIASTLANMSAEAIETLADGGGTHLAHLAAQYTPARAATAPEAEHVTRYSLGEGVEVLVSSHASDQERALVAKILDLANRTDNGEQQ